MSASSSSTRFGTASHGRSKTSSAASSAAANNGVIRELLPKQGLVHCEDSLTFVLCKPKLLPLKSYTMEKLEKIQQESMEKAKQEIHASNLD